MLSVNLMIIDLMSEDLVSVDLVSVDLIKLPQINHQRPHTYDPNPFRTKDETIRWLQKQTNDIWHIHETLYFSKYSLRIFVL